MNFVITNAGLLAANNANSGGPKINITAFKVGAGVAYSPSVSDTALHGSVLHTAAPASYNVLSAVQIEYVLTMNDTIGDFSFGEIGLYLEDGTLFALSSLTQTQQKIAVNGNNPGNTVTISAKLNVTNVTAIIDFPITQMTNAKVLEIGSIDLLVPPSQALGNAFIVHSNDDSGNPILAIKENANEWRFNTHSTRLPLSGDHTGAVVAGYDVDGVLAILDGGANYNIGDILEVDGGTLHAQNAIAKFQVATVNAGAVTGLTMLEQGHYVVGPPTTNNLVGGSGTGLQVTLEVDETNLTTALGTNDLSPITNLSAGKYIIQFLSGANIGLCRNLSAYYAGVIRWSTALPVAPSVADTFEIYQSDSSLLETSLGDYLYISGGELTGPLTLSSETVVSSRSPVPLAYMQQYVAAVAILKTGGTMQGALYASGNPTGALQVATKDYVDQNAGLLGGAGWVRKPINVTPAADAVSVATGATLTASAYYSLYGLSQNGAQFQVHSTSDFTTPDRDSGTLGAVNTWAISPSLSTSTGYFWRCRFRDSENAWSDWSTTTGFTTGANWVTAPTITNPVAASINNLLSPVLTSSAFAYVGAADTHAASQWQISTDTNFGTVTVDSGTDTVNKVQWTATGAGTPLAISTQYFCRVRHQGTNDGWSSWSASSNFTTGLGIPFVDDVFSAYTYTGNGATQTITNGIDLAGEGGMVWVKARDQAYGHRIGDTVRAWKYLDSSVTSAANSGTGSTYLDFISNGFSLGSASAAIELNNSNDKFTSWTFRNAPNFFNHSSVVKSSGSNATVSFPELTTLGMVVVKRTDVAGSWYVWHRSLTAGKLLYLEQTAAEATLGHITVSGTTVTLVNGVIADGTYIVYAWAHDTSAEGIIQCGSFTTDGSGNATVTLGWEPQWLTAKNATNAAGWIMLDTMRKWNTSTTDAYLLANSSQAEVETDFGTPTATGFTFSGNASSTYIYLAIRRPNKPPTVGTEVYNAIARTGTGAAATVTGVGFAPDLYMGMGRDSLGNSNWAYDRLRGNPVLKPNQTAAETADTAFTSFNVSGITIGPDSQVNFNTSTKPYIDWFFRRAPGFFDEVCYTGTGAAKTEVHNLGVVPELIIVKCRNVSARNWCVYTPEGSGYVLWLNGNESKQAAGTAYWNATSPTSSVFSVGTDVAVNSSADTYVSHLFATLAGISKVGSYTGNGTSQTIACGFSTGVRFILIKRTDTAGDWFAWDTDRGITSANDPHLSLNTTAAEVTSDDSIDPHSTGFVVNQVAATNINVTSATYIFLAIA